MRALLSYRQKYRVARGQPFAIIWAPVTQGRENGYPLPRYKRRSAQASLPQYNPTAGQARFDGAVSTVQVALLNTAFYYKLRYFVERFSVVTLKVFFNARFTQLTLSAF
ncbi:MAG: hypothetical protein R3F53_26660 [Gammaproteobacteria bacterium]